MTPTEKHRETAREVVMGWATSDGLVGLEDRVATALAKAEREGMKRAAEIARDELVEVYDDSPDVDVEFNRLVRRISSTILSEAGEG